MHDIKYDKAPFYNLKVGFLIWMMVVTYIVTYIIGMVSMGLQSLLLIRKDG